MMSEREESTAVTVTLATQPLMITNALLNAYDPNPPPTAFASGLHSDGTPLISSIDWAEVLEHEPHHVAQWSLYLHRQRLPEFHYFLQYLSPFLTPSEVPPFQWTVFKRTGLMRVLLGIILEPGMFNDEDESLSSTAQLTRFIGSSLRIFSPQGVSYGLKILCMLWGCIRQLFKAGRAHEDTECVRELYEKRADFYRFLWEKRSLCDLISYSEEESTDDGPTSFSMFATLSLIWLLSVFWTYFREMPPLSMHASHFLLYQLAFTDDEYRISHTLRCLRSFMEKDFDGIQAFVANYFNHFETDDHARLLWSKIFCLLQDEKMTGRDALNLCQISSLTILAKPDSLVFMNLSEGEGLVPSYLMWFHRQMCSSSLRPLAYLSAFLPAFRVMLQVAPEAANEQITSYAADLDFVSILGIALVTYIRDMASGWIEMVQTVVDLLKLIEAPLVESLRDRGSATHAEGFDDLFLAATAHMSVNVRRLVDGYVNPPTKQAMTLYLLDITVKSNIAKQFLVVIVNLFSDVLITWRVYMVWERNWKVAVLPALLCAGVFTSGTSAAVYESLVVPGQSIFLQRLARWGTAQLALSLTMNVTATVLIAFRIWFVTREVRRSNSEMTRMYWRIIVVIVESASFAAVMQTLELALYEAKSPVIYFIADTTVQVVAMSPLLIIVLVGLTDGSRRNDSWSVSYETSRDTTNIQFKNQRRIQVELAGREQQTEDSSYPMNSFSQHSLTTEPMKFAPNTEITMTSVIDGAPSGNLDAVDRYMLYEDPESVCYYRYHRNDKNVD
ncbi:hypothetical protein EIP91_003740 [Steccherinum ochraceum]|uniref:Transmembrane protein n=1 Tax=Steccherinum ochraceum TaxID=92696 RepID=A0A4R0RRF9_9APHY|nr:hypothetical protein EIP91_003740 [Steccherinum ochraceum]